MTQSGGTADLDEVRRRLDESPMNTSRIAVVALAVLLSAVDGYDVLSVTFAAPAITQDWRIGRETIGVLLSSGLLGMAAGSLLLAPLADIVGRRRLALAALVLMGAGMLLSSFAQSLEELAAWRVLTGAGVGACVALIISIVSEFSNARRRPLALSLAALGYPAGGVAGGLLAAWLLTISTWHTVFFVGFVVAAVLLPAVWFLLPESPSLLLARARPDDLPRLNAALRRCGQPELAMMPAAQTRRRSAYLSVFAQGQLGTTLRVMMVNALLTFASYYVLSWLPQLVADLGFAASTASLVSSSANLGGIVGGLLLGVFAHYSGPRRITATAIFGLSVAIAAFGYAPPEFGILLASAAACGFFMFASAAGMYSVIASSFEDRARASGSGFVMGVGRITSAVAPLIAGWLFASGLGRDHTSAAFAICAAVAGLFLLTGTGKRKAPLGAAAHSPTG